MPIFLPLLDNFGINPVFFGVLIGLNLQTSFLSPPVAMAAFYLKGVALPSVRLDDIFAGGMPYTCIVVVTTALIHVFPGIVTWLPEYLDGGTGAPAGITVDAPPAGGFVEEAIDELPPMR